MGRLFDSLHSAARIVRRVLRYLAGLEWTEKRQDECKFCDRSNFKIVVHEDEDTIAFENARLGGRLHWLIIPRLHIRDIEALTSEHVQLLEKLERVKTILLDRYCPGISPSSIHSGFHRGRRALAGSVFWPDIISIHHIHLHVIVEPRPILKLFKYPTWLPLMWKSDKRVMQEVRRKEEESSIEHKNR